MSTQNRPSPTAAITRAPDKLQVISQTYAIASSLLFLATGIIYLVLGRWPVTHQDFWRIYDTCLHQSWMASALLKYNGHSHFFPSQFWLADLKFFHGNQDFLFTAGLAFQLLGTTLLLFSIWRDRTITSVNRLWATTVLVVFSFWMGRASMTASGGFNCCYSLTLTGAALAFFTLGLGTQPSSRTVMILCGVIAGGFLASFSFGVGLATWVTAIAMAYALRLRLKVLIVLGIAGGLAALIFLKLPSREAAARLIAGKGWTDPSTYLQLASYFFHMLGSPLMQMASLWTNEGSFSTGLSAWLAVLFGIGGTILAVTFLLLNIIRRDLRFGLGSTAFGLVVFNLTAFLLITLARADHIRKIPTELDAPRYYYWSSLFWAGLFLFGLRLGETPRFLRRLAICAVLLLPIFASPSHYHEGKHCRYVRLLSNEAATSLICGVKDPQQVQILSPSPDLVFRLASEMRARKLDMFAAGYQDWLGRPASNLFGQDRRAVRFKGTCETRTVPSTNPSAARIVGTAVDRGKGTPAINVVLDSRDIVSGLAPASTTPAWMSRLLYGGVFVNRKFVGFVAPYDPQERYSLRAVEGRALSAEMIEVPPADAQSKKNP